MNENPDLNAFYRFRMNYDIKEDLKRLIEQAKKEINNKENSDETKDYFRTQLKKLNLMLNSEFGKFKEIE